MQGRRLRPTFDAQLLTGLPAGTTFTRATNATFFGSNGLLQVAGNNVPRFDYDPVTLAPRGLLVEEQRTNLLTFSAEFDNAAWNNLSNATWSANQGIAPDGTLTADALVETTATGFHQYFRGVPGLTAGTGYVYSCFLKAGLRTQGRIQIDTIGTNGVYADFDLSNGSIGLVTTYGTGATSLGAGIAPAGNGWFRVWIGMSHATITTFFPQMFLRNSGSLSYAGVVANAMLLWGAQLEAGASPTSYIPTTSAAVTFNADVAVMTGTAFSNWFNAAAGTFVVEAALSQTASDSMDRVLFAAHDNSVNNSIYAARMAGSAQVIANVFDGGVMQVNLFPGSITAGQTFRQSLAYALNDHASALDGGNPASTAIGTAPAAVNRLTFGSGWTTANNINGWIRRLTYYNSRLPDERLQALSA